jgi:hypothetical protein
LSLAQKEERIGKRSCDKEDDPVSEQFCSTQAQVKGLTLDAYNFVLLLPLRYLCTAEPLVCVIQELSHYKKEKINVSDKQRMTGTKAPHFERKTYRLADLHASSLPRLWSLLDSPLLFESGRYSEK